MSVDLKLIKWIRGNATKYSRDEMIKKLKQEGYSEQDIIDSYEEVAKDSKTIEREEGAGKGLKFVSFIFPLIGIIISIVFFVQERKRAGKDCLFWALVPGIIMWIVWIVIITVIISSVAKGY